MMFCGIRIRNDQIQNAGTVRIARLRMPRRLISYTGRELAGEKKGEKNKIQRNRSRFTVNRFMLTLPRKQVVEFVNEKTTFFALMKVTLVVIDFCNICFSFRFSG